MKKFLYKILSNFDGFFPKRIPSRLVENNCLRLGWQRYIDDVDMGDEVWVYFHGTHKFEHGVYVKGIVQNIDIENFEVRIRIRECSTESPLTDTDTSHRIAQVVAPRYRQVFLYPQEWFVVPQCNIQSTADSCNHRLCEDCPAWQGLSLISEDDYAYPQRLQNKLSDFVPAFWIRTKRGHLYSRASPAVRRTSEIFNRFKLGDEALAFPLALGMFEALRRRKNLNFDCIVPIPLSPEKADKGELNRTFVLAAELARLLGTKVVSALSLNTPISKRRLVNSYGLTKSQFETLYSAALCVSNNITKYNKILLLDDVCTQGSTLRVATNSIKGVHPECNIFAVTAGQMIIKSVVVSEDVIIN